MLISAAAAGIDAVLLSLIGVVVWAKRKNSHEPTEVPMPTGRVVWRGKYLNAESRTEYDHSSFVDGPQQVRTATVFSTDGQHHEVNGKLNKPWFLRRGTPIEIRDLGNRVYQLQKERV